MHQGMNHGKEVLKLIKNCFSYTYLIILYFFLKLLLSYNRTGNKIEVRPSHIKCVYTVVQALTDQVMLA
jgi:hypothetical protein